jgi:hypothetical protein
VLIARVAAPADFCASGMSRRICAAGPSCDAAFLLLPVILSLMFVLITYLRMKELRESVLLMIVRGIYTHPTDAYKEF